MRTGGCTAVQHGLSGSAAWMLKQALALARRRGHAQVTPLHVAAAMLSSGGEDGDSATLFLRACVSSHPHLRTSSHPLQCRALDLCFGVALNRLPTTSPPSSSNPSLSNALVAALKRAQAQQRRGCADAPPAAPAKVELEQLAISVLDDPSVSRVMREAGFSSTCVKKTMEERCHSWGLLLPPSFPQVGREDEDDVKFLTDVLISGKNAVVVGDECCRKEVVGKLMSRVRKGKLPEELRFVNFIRFQLYPDEVERRVEEMRRKIEAFMVPWSGVVVYVGDLRWAETRTLERETGAADYLVAEVARLVREMEEGKDRSRVWLVATASYETYLRCKTRRPSLESLWALQPVPAPSDGLALSLHAQSTWDSRTSWNLVQQREEHGELVCGEDRSSTSPFWLKLERSDGHLEMPVSERRRKWSMTSQSLEQDQVKRRFRPNLPWKNQSLFTDAASYRLGDSVAESDGGSSSFLVKSRKDNGKSEESEDLGFRAATTTNQLDLWRRLSEGIPWQSESMRFVAEALIDQGLDEGRGAWLLVEGDDDVGKRRLPAAIAESFGGFRDRIVQINLEKPPITSHSETIMEALRNNPRCVISIEEIHLAHADFMKFLAEIYEIKEAKDQFGCSVTSSDAVFILSTSIESDPRSQKSFTNQRASSSRTFDLNVSAEEEEDEAIAAMNTGAELRNPSNFLASIAARIAMNTRFSHASELHFPSSTSSSTV